MLSCLAFVAFAQTMPDFISLPRGSTRLESGHISSQIIEDTRTFLKAQDGSHYYLVESKFGPLKRFVEKVPQRGLDIEFCGIMDVDFSQKQNSIWSFKGHLTAENGGNFISGEVDIAQSYFFNHTVVDSPNLLHLTVKALPAVEVGKLDLSSVVLCEDELMNVSCGEVQDLSNLKL
ncbi:MAG: hypothetical protein K2P81_13285 [Bacteriovoracaceae bacterium]|nr:hypothetical protein [Bacteriovoracaceae bacterium]